MHPWITFLKERRKRLSDVEFMSIKQFEGKILKGEGSLGATGTLTSVTPASGKTFYLAEAKAEFDSVTIATATQRARVELQNNAIIVDELYSSVRVSGSNFGAGTPNQSKSIIKGDSLVGDGIKVYRLQVVVFTNYALVHGTIIGYIENDADDPRV